MNSYKPHFSQTNALAMLSDQASEKEEKFGPINSEVEGLHRLFRHHRQKDARHVDGRLDFILRR